MPKHRRTLLLALLFLAASTAQAAALACRAVDGDTIVCAGETIRISNIDTPELGSHARCASEAELAARAKTFTATRLAAGEVVLHRDVKRPRDRYGRTLATVAVDGRDLGEALVAAGLARVWDGRRHPWCG
ncbi:MAG: thermonuclease family protein [Proteobacteria bacterium]|nr:thermonuclease family protein [Pseudomonadota bacterium]